MIEHIQGNKFSYLNNSEIVFCKTDFINQAFEKIKGLNKKIILITGNSDYSITNEIVKHCPTNVEKWYAINAESDLPVVEGIPLGLDNSIECKVDGHGYVWDHAIIKPSILFDVCNKKVDCTHYIYANFTENTHPSRKQVASICKSLSYITCEINQVHQDMNSKDYRLYTHNILKHKMVVCPRGNGVDTHRLWETLYLNRIPIIQKNPAMKWFKELPIIFLDDWEQLKNKDLLEKKYFEVINNDKRMLDFSFWKTKITNYEHN